jgi:predicted Zn-dependent protease with MMP-like domain
MPRISDHRSRARKGDCFSGLFHGVPSTKKSGFDIPTGPDHIVLYQKNIEAVCSNDAEVCEQIRLTVIHELGHYFGLDEEQLKDVSPE